MVIHFLVEDASGGQFLEEFMRKYNAEMPEFQIEYTIRPYKGLGGFPKGRDAKNNKSQQLLSDLPKRLRALNAAMLYAPDSSVFIVLDNDKRNTASFRVQLETVAAECNIRIDHVFCIAVEELEAWLLADAEALKAAYPRLSDRISSKLPNYQQDDICDTWEFLADILTKGGIKSFRKQNPSPFDVGRCKSEWATKIGRHMNIRRNGSPSFQYMLTALDQRRDALINGREE